MGSVIYTEIWKDIPGYEGLYQVSNQGSVRALMFRNNIVSKEKIHRIKPTDNGNGYLIVSLNNGGKRKNHYVHRLVAEAFCPGRRNKYVVNHIDYDRTNNSADNLEWCTQKANVRHSAALMKHEKKNHKATNTGEKYIRKVGNSYRVAIQRLGKYKRFKSLTEAIEFRNEVRKSGE